MWRASLPSRLGAGAACVTVWKQTSWRPWFQEHVVPASAVLRPRFSTRCERSQVHLVARRRTGGSPGGGGQQGHCGRRGCPRPGPERPGESPEPAGRGVGVRGLPWGPARSGGSTDGRHFPGTHQWPRRGADGPRASCLPAGPQGWRPRAPACRTASSQAQCSEHAPPVVSAGPPECAPELRGHTRTSGKQKLG